jgi:glycosyltransferase involved in cell wall biosynthesis
VKKIFLIAPNLNRGGAERVISIIADNLSKEKFDVTLVLLNKEGSYLTDLVDVKIVDLQSKRVTNSFFPLLKLLYKERPNIVLSTLAHLNFLISVCKILSPKNIKFIAREASIPSFANQYEKSPCLFGFLYKLLYPLFDKIVCQSNYMCDDLVNNFSISRNKTVVINNPVDSDKIINLSQCEHSNINEMNGGRDINIVSVGSLERVKNFSVLLEAMSMITNRDIRLTIIGSGSQKEMLIKKIDRLGLSNRVNLVGFKKNPYIYMRNAKLVVMTSLYEGFPNTVLESLIVGTPVLAFNCPGGVAEIIINNESGWLVDNMNACNLAKYIEKKIDHNLNGEKISELTAASYSKRKIIKKYEELFDSFS